jgi:hypothetical protein
MRRALVVALACFALAGPAYAAPTELTGTVMVSTSTAGSALVHFANATRTFPNADGKGAIDFKFTGSSFVRGVVLLSETATPDGRRFAGYVDGSPISGVAGEWTSSDIPAGDYRLYAFADGRPTTVTITMPTPGGTSTLDLSDAVPYDYHPMQPGGGGVFRASAATTGAGTMFSAVEVAFGAGQAGTVEFCEALGQSADSDASYSLGCSRGGVDAAVGGADLGSAVANERFDAPGAERFGFGGNAQSLTPPAIQGGIAAITFLPSGAPGQGSTPLAPVGAAIARVVGTSVRVTKTGRAPIRVRCSGPDTCHVRLSITGSSSKGKATIPAGATRKVNVRLSASQRKRLKRARSLKATLVMQVIGQAGRGTTVTRKRITLKAPKR